MMETISNVIYKIDGMVWGWWLIILLFGTHIYMTIRTGFIQRKTISKGIKLSVQKDPDAEGEVSNFGALTTALAATIGTGNIVGVGTAIALGGPGAVLWCWLSGIFGIATKYSESLIAVKYRVKTKDGRMQGGAMYALSRGLKWKKLGKLLGMNLRSICRLCIFWNWLCDTGKCHCQCSGREYGGAGLDRRSGRSNTHSNRYFRRNQIYRYSM